MVYLDLTEEDKALLNKLQTDINCTQQELISFGLLLLWDFYNFKEQLRQPGLVEKFVESRLQFFEDDENKVTLLASGVHRLLGEFLKK